MTEDIVKNDIGQMVSSLAARETKWRRTLNRYENNGRRMEDLYNPYGQPVAFYYGNFYSQETGIIPALNLIRSCVDTHVSKIRQEKLRPFFNGVNGTFKTRKVCRNAQVWFDKFFEEEDIYVKAALCLRDSDIFEVGYMWIDEDTKSVKRLQPWQFLYDRAEFQNGRLTRCAIKLRNEPLIYYKNMLPAELKSRLAETPGLVGTIDIYYNIIEGEKWYFVNGIKASKTKINYHKVPVAWIYYSDPIKGGYAASMVDLLYPLQTEVDMLLDRIHTATALNPANTIFVPGGSKIKESMLTNEIGMIVPYEAVSGAPVTVSTPAPISPQYIELLNMYEQKAYNIVGVSQLSAQAKKPSGLNSGVALDTLQDVESERHQTTLDNYIRFLVDITNLIIDVFPEDEDILPQKLGTSKIKWKEIKKQRDLFAIQIGKSSVLSNDPKTKMEQIEKLLAMKMIDQSQVSSLMEIPDLERAYSQETASLDVCERVIERAIEDEQYDFYETVNIEQLKNLVQFYINRLDANDEDPVIILRLINLYKTVIGKADEIKANLNPAPELSPIAPPTMQGPTNELPITAGEMPMTQAKQTGF